MLNKREIILRLEEERKFAVESGLTQLALGIARSILIIKIMEDSK